MIYGFLESVFWTDRTLLKWHAIIPFLRLIILPHHSKYSFTLVPDDDLIQSHTHTENNNKKPQKENRKQGAFWTLVSQGVVSHGDSWNSKQSLSLGQVETQTKAPAVTGHLSDHWRFSGTFLCDTLPRHPLTKDLLPLTWGIFMTSRRILSLPRFLLPFSDFYGLQNGKVHEESIRHKPHFPRTAGFQSNGQILIILLSLTLDSKWI